MIFRGPFPEVSIPEVPLTQFVLGKATERGHKPALIEGPTGRIVTYAQLYDAIGRVAASLAARGFKKGEVFGILSPNVPEYAIIFHAVASLGGINTPVNPLYTEQEVAHQLKDAGARFLVAAPSFIEKARQAAKEANIEELFVFGEAPGATAFASLLDSDGTFPEVEINPRKDLVVLPYSSGTTGLPKGVMLTHYNLVANLCQMDGIAPVSERDTVIAVLPFFHIYGMEVILHHGLSKGATLIVMSRFELEPFLAALERHAVSRAYLVPPIVLALAKHPLVEQYDLSSLKTIVC